jgi:hypothetical protein
VLVALLRDLDNQTRFLIIDPVALTAHQLLNDAKTRELWSGSVTVGMTPLPDGEVLVTGGTDFDGRAFVFDPMNDQMAQIHSMSTPRTGHAAVALSDGRVLVAAGRSSYSPASVYYVSDGQLSSAEIYDPATASFTAAGELPSVRGQAWGSRLPDGRVLLIAIGDRLQFGLPQAETVALDVFDPATNTFSALRPQDWPGPPTFTALPDGRVLVTGIAPDRSSAKLSKVPWAAIYDPIAQTTTEVQAPPQVFPQGAALSDGRVIVVGGFRDDPTAGAHVPVPWIEIFQ